MCVKNRTGWEEKIAGQMRCILPMGKHRAVPAAGMKKKAPADRNLKGMSKNGKGENSTQEKTVMANCMKEVLSEPVFCLSKKIPGKRLFQRSRGGNIKASALQRGA